MLGGCAKEEHTTTTLNIGYQKYGILPILKARGDLEKALKDQGVQVKWVEFPAGPQLLEGLNVGSVSLGEAGEAPPILLKQPIKFSLCCKSTCCTKSRSLIGTKRFSNPVY